MSNKGYIYDLEDGRFAIACHEDQDRAMWKQGKSILRLFADPMTTIPILDPVTKRQKKIIKSVINLKFIGYHD